MKNAFILLSLALITSTGCRHAQVEKGVPACVKQKISNFDTHYTCSDASVQEFTFQSQTVYLFDPGTCGADMTAEVINSDCSSLGSLGGISGNQEINGTNFSAAVYVKTVWQK